MILRQITVQNFGPIKNGAVELKPLTIFIGPNNSGKSYMSALVYSVLSSEHLGNAFRPRVSSNLRKSMKKEMRAAAKQGSGGTITIPTDALRRMYLLIIEGMFGNHLRQNLARNFLTNAKNLARRGASAATIKISTFADVTTGLNGDLKIDRFVPPGTKYVFKMSDHVSTFDITKDKSEITVTVGREHKQEFFRQSAADLMMRMMRSELCKNGVPQLIPFYLPASRSGILKTYQETAASMMNDVSYSVPAGVDEPAVGGITADFIAPLIALRRKKTPFFKLAEEMERDVLNGSIGVRMEKGGLPRFLYAFDGNDIPLDNASSAVSELAPLFVYLKYVVRENGLLIIEEPESHLHPRAQAMLAKYVVKLVNEGLRMLVTTHSVFFLAEFGKYVLADRLDEKARKRLKINAHISADDVSPYVFKKTTAGKGYGIRRIPFDDENGISQEEFGRVEHELYDQWLSVASNLPKK